MADVLAADEFYELVLVASTQTGTVYNAGSVRGKGETCDGVYSTACVKLIANEQFMRGFHPDGVDGNGEWYVQVVRQTGADQYTREKQPMAADREIKRRIRSVKNIAKVTRAMEAVSASKMRRAQAQVEATRPYAGKAWEVLTFLARLRQSQADLQPLLQDREIRIARSRPSVWS